MADTADIYTREQLNKLSPEALAEIVLSQQAQLKEANRKLAEVLQKQESLEEKMQLLMEQLILQKQERFGRSSEKMEPSGQIAFLEVDGQIVFFNEAEAVSNPEETEPEELEEKKIRKPRPSGQKKEDIKDLPVQRVDHYLTEDELIAEFGPSGWKQLPDAIMRHYRFIPAKIEVEEHHIGVYADKADDRIIKAPHPKSLLHGSLVSPSIAAAVMNGKYVNAVPLYRLEQEFLRQGLKIPRKNMANWMIRLSDDYLSLMYDRMHELLYSYHVIQADETPVLVNKDGRQAGSKSYMWVYRSGHMYRDRQIILYDYQKTRNASHPREFLKDFSGVCLTDGYQVYHTLAREREDLMIAGCWTHMRRRFDEALKVVKEPDRKKSFAYPVMNQIQAIYHEEGKLKDLTADERLVQRQLIIKPLVDALFLHLKQSKNRVPRSGKLMDAFSYALNQEKYLRVFLDDGEVPIDNNASEQAIRGFCIGKKNWEFIDTINGAKSSAVIYSIAETAKANNLKPYDYFEYLLTEIPKHMEETDRGFLDDLLPWSDGLPESIRKPIK